jgi:hypothetical protein
MMLLRLVTLAGLLSIGLCADTLTDTLFSGTFFDPGNCTGFDCSYTYSIPQFNPALGTLNEIDWSLQEFGEVDIDPDYCSEFGEPLPPIPYSYTSTVSDAILNGSGSVTHSQSGLNYGGCAGADNIGYQALLTFGSTITDVSAYIGTGSVLASTDPTISGSGDIEPGLDAYFRNWGSELTLTYDYNTPSSVPEPRLYVLLLVFLILSVAYHRTQRRKTPTTKTK